MRHTDDPRTTSREDRRLSMWRWADLRHRSGVRAHAGDQRQSRPRLRRAGPRADPLRRPHRAGDRRGLHGHGARRGRRRAARRRGAPGGAGHAGHLRRVGRAARRAGRGVRQPHPAGARHGLLVGGHRRWRAAGPGAGRGRPRTARRRGCAADRGPARGSPRQRGAVSARRVHHRLDRGHGGAGRAIAGRCRRTADGFRSRRNAAIPRRRGRRCHRPCPTRTPRSTPAGPRC